MYNPPHPGELLREMFAEQKLTVVGAAKKLGMPSRTLSDVVNGNSRLTVKLAIKLAQIYNTTAESWLTMQMHHDLWKMGYRADANASLMQPPEN